MSLLALALALTTDAHAGIYGGNPGITIKVVRPANDLLGADVTLEKVRVNYCGGGFTDYAVNGYVDLVVGYQRTITGGDICGIRSYWDSEMDIEGSAFLLEYDSLYTDVSVTPTGPVPANLTPFTVIQGSIYGQGPQLVVTIR